MDRDKREKKGNSSAILDRMNRIYRIKNKLKSNPVLSC